jgi:hypothetical protein
LDLNPTIARQLLKFRFGLVAAIADLQKAFLQIRIHEDNRDWLRFLWLDRLDRVKVLRMTSLPFGATCSPFLLAIVIRHHLLKLSVDSVAARRLLGNIYVDDAILTSDSVDEMSELHRSSVDVFEQCSMVLHKWRCSDTRLDAAWTDGPSPLIVKVLGVCWSPLSDVLFISAPVSTDKQITRRVMLSSIHLV